MRSASPIALMVLAWLLMTVVPRVRAQAPPSGSCRCTQPGAASSAASSAAPSAAPGPTDAAFIAVYKADEVWRRAQRGAESAEDEKQHLPPAHLPHVDAATEAKELAHWEDVLAQLNKVDAAKLSPAERLNYEVYRAQIAVNRNAGRFREYERPVNSDTAFWTYLAPTDGRGFRREVEYERYIARMREIGRYFEEEEADMRAGAARGFTSPRVTLEGRDEALRVVAESKTAEATKFYAPFVSMPASIGAAEQARLRAEAVDVIAHIVMPAYARLLRFFDTEYMPHTVTALAAESLPDGKAYYQAQILEYTTTTMTPEEIHALGLSEMAKIHAEMLSTMQASGFGGSFAEFLHFLRTDPQFYAKTPQELLDHAAWVAKEFDGVANRYFGYEPRGRFGIVPVPPDLAPTYTAGRGGTGNYMLNTYDLPSRPLFQLPALTLHESAPGHAWQGAIAQELERDEHRPAFRRAYISAYGEGWALYCERLGDEMGIYKTPYERFGMLSYQAWRAARLVVDTGIHSQGWTREQAQQYLRENTALSDREIGTEVDRYISWPGQALSYYLGEADILRLRAKAEKALGPKFNLRAFHDAVLNLGSVPLPVLDEQIDAWIAGGGIGPFPEMER